jgi:hypothetical protein
LLAEGYARQSGDTTTGGTVNITLYDVAMILLGGTGVIGAIWSAVRMEKARKAGKVKVVGIVTRMKK